MAEQLIQKDDILYNEKLLTLSMQEFKNVGMHVSKYASASMQICQYAWIQKYAIMQIYNYANMQVCKYTSMKIYKYTS